MCELVAQYACVAAPPSSSLPALVAEGRVESMGAPDPVKFGWIQLVRASVVSACVRCPYVVSLCGCLAMNTCLASCHGSIEPSG